MIKLKTEVVKKHLIEQLKTEAEFTYKNSWQAKLQKRAFANGTEALLKLLRLDDINNKVAVCADMTNEEIKLEKEKMYEQIKSAEERLGELRTICKHEKTFEGNYSWRIGNIQLADICEYCGELIRFKNYK